MKKNLIITFICLFIASCSSFVKKEEQELLKQYEASAYTMQKDVTIGQNVLPRNTKVRLLILSGDWIKVYALRYDDDILQQRRMLLLYLFQDDFPNGKFDVDVFQEKLYEVARPFKEEDARNTRGGRGR